MLNRRTVLEIAFANIIGGAVLDAATPSREKVAPVFHHDLPDLRTKDWEVTAVEVDYEPGGSSQPHRHPGFVVGYVLEGEIRFQLKGQPVATYGKGQMFYEAPGSVHEVSANASNTRPAKILALVFAPKNMQLTMPA